MEEGVNIGRLLIATGLGLIALGLLLIAAAKLGLPGLGELPGDIVYHGRNTTIYFPIVTCILLSVVLTLVLSLFRRG